MQAKGLTAEEQPKSRFIGGQRDSVERESTHTTERRINSYISADAIISSPPGGQSVQFCTLSPEFFKPYLGQVPISEDLPFPGAGIGQARLGGGCQLYLYPGLTEPPRRLLPV
jgi:hypothetical protein